MCFLRSFKVFPHGVNLQWLSVVVMVLSPSVMYNSLRPHSSWNNNPFSMHCLSFLRLIPHLLVFLATPNKVLAAEPTA